MDFAHGSELGWKDEIKNVRRVQGLSSIEMERMRHQSMRKIQADLVGRVWVGSG